jgi:gag-polyprotein putative aspartyl protease
MKFRFNRSRGPTRIRARIDGPTGSTNLILALDTGATRSLISVAPLVFVGYDPGLQPQRLQMTTGSGVEFVPTVKLERIWSLGKSRENLDIIAHTLPVSAGIDGLLGLDFLRGHRLSIDFSKGEILLD